MRETDKHVPDGMPAGIPDGSVADLLDTITGLVNESTLTRAEILGVLEAAKLRIWWGWQRAHETFEGPR